MQKILMLFYRASLNDSLGFKELLFWEVYNAQEHAQHEKMRHKKNTFHILGGLHKYIFRDGLHRKGRQTRQHISTSFIFIINNFKLKYFKWELNISKLQNIRWITGI